MSPDKFIENFPDYAKKYESAPTDLDKILILKSLRRTDVSQLNKYFTKINWMLHKDDELHILRLPKITSTFSQDGILN